MSASSRISDESVFIGGDLGGTTVKMGIIGADGTDLSDPIQVPAEISSGLATTFGNIRVGIEQLCRASGVSCEQVGGFGFATPGPASVDGFIVSSANLNHADWKNVNIREQAERALGIPTVYLNDANAAGLGEVRILDPVPASVAYFAPGTGLGAIDIQNGRLNPGKYGYRGELGHLFIPPELAPFSPPACGCGSKLCVERILSLGGLEFALNIALETEEWKNHPFNDEPYRSMTSRQRACELRGFTWEHNDLLGRELFGLQARAIGFLIYDIVIHFDPDVIIMGGGLVDERSPEWFKQLIVEKARDFYDTIALVGSGRRSLELSFAALGDYAGAYGAAHHARTVFCA